MSSTIHAAPAGFAGPDTIDTARYERDYARALAEPEAFWTEVANEMREAKTASFVNPGRWEQTATLLDIDAPGMPPEAKEMMSKAFGQAHRLVPLPDPDQGRQLPTGGFPHPLVRRWRTEHLGQLP